MKRVFGTGAAAKHLRWGWMLKMKGHLWAGEERFLPIDHGEAHQIKVFGTRMEALQAAKEAKIELAEVVYLATK